MLFIPDIESSPTFDGQSAPDNTDWQAESLAVQGTGVISGCLVSPQSGSSNMNVAVAVGIVTVAGTNYSVSSTVVATVAAASSFDRKDLVIYTPGIGIETSGSGTTHSAAIKGTPCAIAGWTRSSTGFPPVKPPIPTGSVILAEVYVASFTTAITAGNLIDKTATVVPQATYAPLASPAFTGTPTAPTAALGTNTTQIATSSFVARATGIIPTIILNLTNYTLALTDAGTSQQVVNSAPSHITVPTNATIGFPIGTVISFTQVGVGKTYIKAATGVTIGTPGGFTSDVSGCRTQYSTIGLLKRDTDFWILSGDVA